MSDVKQSLLVVVLILCWNIACAEEVGNLFRDKGKKVAARVGYDTVYILSTPLRMDAGSVKNLLLFSGVTYGLMSVENDIKKRLIDVKYEEIGEIVEPLGVTNSRFFQAVGGLYLWGLISNNGKLKKTTFLLSEAALFNQFLTGRFKTIVGRPRPSQQDGDNDDFVPFSGYDAFPSGHTSCVFTLATVVSNQYPSPWVKGVSYTVASLVGLQRLHANAHGAADVFAGACLGIWVGKTICSLDEQWANGNIQFSLNGISIRSKF